MNGKGIFEAYYAINPHYLKAFKVEASDVMEARKIAEAYLRAHNLGKLYKLAYLWPKECEGGKN